MPFLYFLFTMITAFICCGAADIGSTTYAEYQEVLLLRVFEDVSETFFETLPFGTEDIDRMVNNLNGEPSDFHLHFSAGRVVSILAVNWKDSSEFGNLRMNYLPNSLRTIIITGSAQRVLLCTRYFPIECVHINLSTNSYFGNPDFQQLPPNLRSVELQSNRLRGRIALVGLPLNIEHINVKQNPLLGQKVVYAKCQWNVLKYLDFDGTRVKIVKDIATGEQYWKA